MTAWPISELEEVAVAAARAGGSCLARWPREGLRVDTKSSASDFVTAADRAAEEEIGRLIAELRPGDAIVGEEGAARPGTTGLTWIVDPLDGTTNFLRDIAYWGTSVALRCDAGGDVIAGAVCAPALGRLYRAGAGRGASVERLDGTSNRLRLDGESDRGTALLGTGLSYDAARRARQLEALAGLLPVISDVRRLGAASLDLCAVADGGLDGFIESDLESYDYAAGALIAAEAGATISGRRRDEPPDRELVLAAVPWFYELVRTRAGAF